MGNGQWSCYKGVCGGEMSGGNSVKEVMKSGGEINCSGLYSE